MQNRSNIESYIVEVVTPIIPISLQVAETTAVPYCVYNINGDMPSYTKGGDIYKWVSDVSIVVVHTSKADADALMDAIVSSFFTAGRDRAKCNVVSRLPEFSESGLWIIDLNVIITQIK